MDNYGVEEGEPPVYCSTKDHDIDKKRHDDVLEKRGVALDEFSSPERTKETRRKVADRIFRKTYCHGYCESNLCRLHILTGRNLFSAWYPALA